MKSPQQDVKQVGSHSFRESQVLGCGTYSRVYLTLGGQAMKVIPKQGLTKVTLDNVLRQMDILEKVNHPHVVRILDRFHSANNIYIVTQRLSHDLRPLIGKLTPDQALLLWLQVLQAVQFLFNKNILHRDLKPANIMLLNGVCKLIDFGFATETQNLRSRKFNDKAGTPLYMSPQILLGEPYSFKSEVWTLGILLHELAFGDTPWVAKSQQALIQLIREKPYCPSSSHPFISTLIKNCLSWEQGERADLQMLRWQVESRRAQLPLLKISQEKHEWQQEDTKDS